MLLECLFYLRDQDLILLYLFGKYYSYEIVLANGIK